MKSLAATIKAIAKNRTLIWRLSKNDFKGRFAGSMLGRVWGFIMPVVMVLVYWFAFEKGLRVNAARTAAGLEVPFILFLVSGLVPWFYFQDALSGGAAALTDYSYLVKKVVFEIRVLPMVKVVSALFTHIFFVVIAVILYSCYGFFPDLYTLQIVYYSFALIMLCIGLAYLNCAINVFVKDWAQIIGIVLQVGIWITPIMWDFKTLEIPAWASVLIKLNPMYYIVMGYRESFMEKVWFFESPLLTLYFWIFCLFVLWLGMTVFNRLRDHFADVL